VSEPRRPWPDVAAGALLAAGVLCGRALLTRPRLDPDLAFHLAISRETATHGLVRAIPQAAGLTWSQHFPEKEFLFHQLTGLGYRLAGEAGATAAAAAMSVAAAVGLYAVCRRFAGPLRAAATVAGVGLLDGYFLFRLELMRPHVLALVAAEGVLWGLLARRRWATAAAAAVFALAYHTLYIPLGLVAAAAVIVVWGRDRGTLAAVGAGLAGLAAGVLANPYFPSNVLATWTSTRIALEASHAAALGVAAELLPLSPQGFARWFGGALVLSAGAAVLWARGRIEATHRAEVAFLLLATTGLWVLSALNPRAIEYALPLSCVLVAAAWPSGGWPYAATFGLVVLTNAWGLRGLDTWGPEEHFLANTPPVIGHLPANAAGKRVLNCSFEQGSFLFHQRPDVQFVDLSDPQLLLWQKPEWSHARERLKEGDVADPFALIHDVFGADYVLCGHPGATGLLDEDPRFARLAPPPGVVIGPETGPGLYRVLPQVDSPATLEIGFTVIPSADSLRTLRPSGVSNRRPVAGGALVDLAALAGAAPNDQVRCASVNIPSAEAALHPSARFVGVGGGPLLKIFVSGDARFEGGPFTRGRLVRALVPLHPGADPPDDVEALVCAPAHASRWDVSVSFWTADGLEDTCRAKGAAPPCIAPVLSP
jgi:hypothetical protein